MILKQTIKGNESYQSNAYVYYRKVKDLELKICCFLLLSVLIRFDVHSQDELSVNYSFDDGMPSNQIYSVYQDKNGLMWFASDRGIASYNGSYFKIYGLPEGLPDDVVFGFYPQKNGWIYCSTLSNQVFYFHPDSMVMHSYQYNDVLRSIPPAEMRDIHIDKTGFRCRFLYRTGYIKICPKGKLTTYEFEYLGVENDSYISKVDGFSYTTQKKGNNRFLYDFWGRHVYAINGKYTCASVGDGLDFTTEDTLIKHVKLQENNLLSQSDIGNTDKGFWVATVSSGLHVYSSRGKLLRRYLPDITASYYFESKDGVWIATLYNGVYYFPVKRIEILQETVNRMIYSLSSDGEGGVLVGFFDRKLQHYNQKLKLLSEDDTKTEGISEYGWIEEVLVDNRKEKNWTYASKISDDKSKPLLLISGHQIYNLQGDRLLSLGYDKSVYDAEYMGENILYANSEGVILTEIQGAYSRLKRMNSKVQDLDIYKDKVYLATKGEGLLILDKRLNLLERITTKDGLLSNYLTEVLCTDDGMIWLCGRNGVNIIKTHGGSRKIYKITTTNGLLHREVRDIFIDNNIVFIATNRGVNYFDLNDFYEIVHSNVEVKLRLLSITTGGKVIEAPDMLRYDQNNITFNFELAAFIPNSELTFRYRLLGHDSTWIVTQDRSVIFSSLDPGRYVVEIQALVDGDAQGEKLIRSITIHPAFYNLWWFRLSVVLFLVIIIWLFFKYRILNYNREIIREILRQLLKRLKPKGKYFIVRSNGKDVKIDSGDVLYVESSGNYIHIYTTSGKTVVREKLSSFKDLVPDPLEYIQLRRSLIIRIDCVSAKSVDTVTVNGIEFKVGNTYLPELKKIEF